MDKRSFLMLLFVCLFVFLVFFFFDNLNWKTLQLINQQNLILWAIFPSFVKECGQYFFRHDNYFKVSLSLYNRQKSILVWPVFSTFWGCLFIKSLRKREMRLFRVYFCQKKVDFENCCKDVRLSKENWYVYSMKKKKVTIFLIRKNNLDTGSIHSYFRTR